MPDILIYADTLDSAELRHEVPVSIGDPFLYAEHDGTRHIVVSALETPRLAGLGFEPPPHPAPPGPRVPPPAVRGVRRRRAAAQRPELARDRRRGDAPRRGGARH